MQRPTPQFRSWLLEQLRIRQWSQSDLATRAGFTRSAVTKWLAPVDSTIYRQPTYESCRTLARVLGVPLASVLEAAGLDAPASEATSLQRKVMALIPHIPDALLEVVYRQLVPMVDARVQEELLTALRTNPPPPPATDRDGDPDPNDHGRSTPPAR